ncbi:2976_t:CDS:2 [Paraglomus occultum]|uniref:2976_t:CDS:1 n=1 Tax=Paraglomus occultum TaxID=144539 RepID=A0A9N9B463_9GLOM|nr:2976_t:CDS:2 [Paraglomus occultum]
MSDPSYELPVSNRSITLFHHNLACELVAAVLRSVVFSGSCWCSCDGRCCRRLSISRGSPGQSNGEISDTHRHGPEDSRAFNQSPSRLREFSVETATGLYGLGSEETGTTFEKNVGDR